MLHGKWQHKTSWNIPCMPHCCYVGCIIYKKAKKEHMYFAACKVHFALFNVYSWSVVKIPSLGTDTLHRRKLIHGRAQRICGCLYTGCGKNKGSSFFLLCCGRYYCAFMSFLSCTECHWNLDVYQGQCYLNHLPFKEQGVGERKGII